jgi:hypothetical protein
MVGIVEEQHPERARLFMQWKQMGWPILTDPLNLLGVWAVPITLLIDEHGIIRSTRAKPADIQAFVDSTYAKPADVAARQPSSVPDLKALEAAARSGGANEWRALGDAKAMWGGISALDAASEAYEHALRLAPTDGIAHFRLGVVTRMRYDSEARREGDFSRAVAAWERALEINPNQYIWRRRIQQYGPRLNKPYPFYDWVTTARSEIAARGDAPTSLNVEPGATELAAPVKAFDSAAVNTSGTDADARITRDDRLIDVEVTVVPGTITPGAAARVHIALRPNSEARAHWNNEAGQLVYRISPPVGWRVDRSQHVIAVPREPESEETRVIEFEVLSPDTASGRMTLTGYVLYYVCENVDGLCLYRRRDIPISIDLTKRKGM